MKDRGISQKKTILIGIGNNCRGDDGIGWRFTDHFADAAFADIDVEYRYQLQVEDAELISHYDIVVFADATKKDIEEGFEISLCEPGASYCYSSHRQEPENILYLSSHLFRKTPEACVVAIAGYNWSFRTSLSNAAEENLAAAIEAFKAELIDSSFITSHHQKNLIVQKGHN